MRLEIFNDNEPLRISTNVDDFLRDNPHFVVTQISHSSCYTGQTDEGMKEVMYSVALLLREKEEDPVFVGALINALELREGNWVAYILPYHKIISRQKVGAVLNRCSHLQPLDYGQLAEQGKLDDCHGFVFFSAIRPIYLGKKVLKCCGFEQMYSEAENKLVWCLGEVEVALAEGIEVFYQGEKIDCKYLHQLQNFFTDTVGVELKVKL